MSKDSYKITLKKLAEVAGKTPEGFSWVVRQRIREWEEAGIIPVDMEKLEKQTVR